MLPGLDYLENAGISHPYTDYAVNRDINQVDITSAGQRASDIQTTVSAIHREEVAFYDPGISAVSITNGDDRATSSAHFRKIMKELYPNADPEEPSEEEILETKKEVIRRWGNNPKLIELNGLFKGVNPDLPVLAYFGRLVDEKAGLKRAFTPENLEAMVKGEGNDLKTPFTVILAANEQAHTRK
jgi:hypothetical protein